MVLLSRLLVLYSAHFLLQWLLTNTDSVGASRHSHSSPPNGHSIHHTGPNTHWLTPYTLEYTQCHFKNNRMRCECVCECVSVQEEQNSNWWSFSNVCMTSPRFTQFYLSSSSRGCSPVTSTTTNVVISSPSWKKQKGLMENGTGP